MLSNHYRLRSLRETVLFLFDLRKKADIYPEALDPPAPLSYVANVPKMKRAISESIARKVALNVKMIPPSIKPFAAELILPESVAKKDYEKLSGLRKIHLMRNMRNNSTEQSSLLPKPPPAPKNLPVSRLLSGRNKMNSLGSESAIIIPERELSEKLLHASDLISSQEMISTPPTAEQSDPHASLHSDSIQDNENHDYSDTESDSSIYPHDDDFEISIESMKPLRPSQPPPSFFKRRQNIALTSSSITPLLHLHEKS